MDTARDYLYAPELSDDETIIFSDSCYKKALIGITTDRRAVYDYDKMVAGLMERDGVPKEEAIEWIEYNTIRALDYVKDGPIVVHLRPQGTEATAE